MLQEMIAKIRAELRDAQADPVKRRVLDKASILARLEAILTQLATLDRDIKRGLVEAKSASQRGVEPAALLYATEVLKSRLSGVTNLEQLTPILEGIDLSGDRALIEAGFDLVPGLIRERFTDSLEADKIARRIEKGREARLPEKVKQLQASMLELPVLAREFKRTTELAAQMAGARLGFGIAPSNNPYAAMLARVRVTGNTMEILAEPQMQGGVKYGSPEAEAAAKSTPVKLGQAPHFGTSKLGDK